MKSKREYFAVSLVEDNHATTYIRDMRNGKQYGVYAIGNSRKKVREAMEQFKRPPYAIITGAEIIYRHGSAEIYSDLEGK